MRRVARWTVRILGGLVALAVIAVAVLWWLGRPPGPDAFYDPPDDVPSAAGELIRDERFHRDVPDGARAWRILYTTTRETGDPAVASALVVASDDPEHHGGGARPVLAWAHGTTGVARGCAPSLLDQPFASIPALRRVLDAGWVVVATDYMGLGTEGPHPYLVGESAGHSVLDSVRAARDLDGPDLDDRTAVWGWSQGGHAALFTGEIAPSYAPELDLVGVAAVDAPTDLVATLEGVKGTPVGKVLAAFTVRSWSEVYPHVDFDDMVPLGERTAARGMASQCLSSPGAYLSGLEAALSPRSVLAVDPSSDDRLAGPLRDNTPRGEIQAPVLLAQGTADQLIEPSVTERYVHEVCSHGQTLEYRTYAGEDHISVVAASRLGDDLFGWTRQRFAGESPESGCRTVRR